MRRDPGYHLQTQLVMSARQGGPNELWLQRNPLVGKGNPYTAVRFCCLKGEDHAHYWTQAHISQEMSKQTSGVVAGALALPPHLAALTLDASTLALATGSDRMTS